MTECLTDELKRFLNQELFITLKGQDFKPKGILKQVNPDFIIIGDERIIINSIASFKPANNGGYR